MAAGALKASCSVVEREEIPLAYMEGESARIRVRVVGDLDLSAVKTLEAEAVEAGSDRVLLPMPQPRPAAELAAAPRGAEDGDSIRIDGATGDWLLRPEDVDAMAIGAGILGTGGGGNATRPALAIRHFLGQHPGATLRIRSLGSLDDDAHVLSGAVMGAPTVSTEKLMSDKLHVAGQAMARTAGIEPDALLCLEIGGGNGLELLYWAALSGLPALDACTMGRAFPEVQMTSSAICASPQMPFPCLLVPKSVSAELCCDGGQTSAWTRCAQPSSAMRRATGC